MGMMRKPSSSSFESSSCCNCPSVSAPVDTGNPDPWSWTILRSVQIGTMLVVEIKYPNCTNYEGKKILLYENITELGLRNQGKVDPHFFPNDNRTRYRSPFARFEPTERGWDAAKRLAAAMG